MAKNYRYMEFDQNLYHFDMIENTAMTKTWMDILEEEKSKRAVAIVNLSYFSLTDGSLQSATKIHGTWKKSPSYQINGLCIDQNGRLFVDNTYCEDAYSFTEGCPPMYTNGNKDYAYNTFPTNGATHIGVKEDGTVCILVCDKDRGISSTNANQIMLDAGCVDVLRMDGSWSSHGSLGVNEVCSPSQYRYDRLYLVVYKNDTIQLMNYTHKVTLDVYGDYSQATHPVSWEVVTRMQAALNRNGIEAMFSNYPEVEVFNSALRAKQSNTWKADICLSIDADLIDGNKAKIISSAAGTTAGRNIMAGEIISALKMYDIPCNDAVTHDKNIIMLASTNATANFIRYNNSAMASNEEVMDTIVEATVEGICNYLGKDYIAPSNTIEDLVEELKDSGIYPQDVTKDTQVTYGALTNVLEALGLI